MGIFICLSRLLHGNSHSSCSGCSWFRFQLTHTGFLDQSPSREIPVYYIYYAMITSYQILSNSSGHSAIRCCIVWLPVIHRTKSFVSGSGKTSVSHAAVIFTWPTVLWKRRKLWGMEWQSHRVQPRSRELVYTVTNYCQLFVSIMQYFLNASTVNSFLLLGLMLMNRFLNLNLC